VTIQQQGSACKAREPRGVAMTFDSIAGDKTILRRKR
jgi:hypothetical protein